MPKNIKQLAGNPDAQEVVEIGSWYRIDIAGTSLDSTSVVTLQSHGSTSVKLELLELVLKPGGSGTTYQARIGEASSWTNGDVDVERVTRDSLATSVNENHSYTANPIGIVCDASGRFYLKPGFNSGSDNTLAGWVTVRPVLAD